MSDKSNAIRYSRLNTFMGEYIEAVNAKADHQELHDRLKNLITEAIRVDITLVKLLKALSVSNALDADTVKFIDNISHQYMHGEDAEQARKDSANTCKEPV